jgi:ABC-2 type transport system permease protein
LLALALLFLLPGVLARVIQHYAPDFDRHRNEVEQVLVFYMIPQALIPLTALVLASGMIRDEVEGQTLTYLLIRPLPRPSIYVAKMVAAWLVASALSAVFITVTLAAIHWEAKAELWGTILPGHALRVSALAALSLLVYVALFGGVSLLTRWVLPLGVAYIVTIEGIFANIDFIVRRLTVLWYIRTLAVRWLDLRIGIWSIDLQTAPTAREALVKLLVAALVLTAAGGWWFGSREIRVKTPEGS